MRIALITLAIAALAFIGSIIWTILPRATTSLANTSIVQKDPPWLTNVEIELIKNQQKILDKLEALEKQWIVKADETLGENVVLASSGSAKTNSGSQSSSGSTEIQKIPTPAVKISGKLLSLLMPTADLKLEENKWIYDLLSFDSLPYSTYLDSRIGLRVIAIDIPYDAFLKNIKISVREVYSINETKTFTFPSFYVNPVKPDTLVRLVASFENQTIAFEIPKTKFPILKALLSKKPTPIITPKTTTKTGSTVR